MNTTNRISVKLSRALIPLAATALLLTGCSTGSDLASGSMPSDCLAEGAASKTIEVSGEVGADLELTSKTPVSVEAAERTVLKKGKGDAPATGQTIEVAMSMFNGTDGTLVNQAPASPVPNDATLATWAAEGIRCGVPGQQVAVVVPYADVFQQLTPEQTGVPGIAEDDSIVIVMEFGEVADAVETPSSGPGTLNPDELLSKAEGKAVAAPEGYPTVELAADGAPTITMPEGVDAPTSLEIATLIEGDGEVVQPGDRVYVNYRGVIWSTGEEFDSSWSRGAPIDFTTDGVIGGFKQALEGQKVGSQVISIVPAEDGGYGAAQLESMGHAPDAVMVFVLDILGTVHAE